MMRIGARGVLAAYDGHAARRMAVLTRPTMRPAHDTPHGMHLCVCVRSMRAVARVWRRHERGSGALCI